MGGGGAGAVKSLERFTNGGKRIAIANNDNKQVTYSFQKPAFTLKDCVKKAKSCERLNLRSGAFCTLHTSENRGRVWSKVLMC